MSDGGDADKYELLFHSPSADALQAQFRAIAGDEYESVPPAMAQAFQDAGQAATETGFNAAAAGICDAGLDQAMSLDKIILSCMFHHAETFCPGGRSDDELETYLKTIRWKLPDVRWGYSQSPPPPPPATFGPFHDMVAADPEGMEALREKMLEFWPALT